MPGKKPVILLVLAFFFLVLPALAFAPCSGTCTACPAYAAQSNCLLQGGCSWAAFSCGGTHTACTVYTNRTDCQAHSCNWNNPQRKCVGSPHSCSTHTSQSPCTTAGCTWSGGCSGTCTSCASFSTQSACQAQGGCTWAPPPAVCGNNIKETGETCDGSDLAGQSCITRGFTGGSLSCAADCLSFNTSACTNYACGNNIKEPGETCDGSDLAGQTCITQGFTGGTLSCAANCLSFNTGACTSVVPSVCGNNDKESGEVCDGSDLFGQTCITQGFAGGSLSCAADCLSFNTSACTNYTCGNNVKESGEACDGSDLSGMTCVLEGFAGGSLSCAADCLSFNTSACVSAVCGNNIKEASELCDGLDLDSQSCASQGFDSGTLACAANCFSFNTGACIGAGPVCGDGIRAGSEVCDGSDFGSQTCITNGYSGGSLSCSADCLSLVTSSCTSEVIEGQCVGECCGNRICEPMNDEDFGTCRVDCYTPAALFFTFYGPVFGESFSRGEKVVIKIGLKADSIAPHPSVVEWVTATSPGLFGTIPLFDDGLHEDGVAGDAIYAGFFLVRPDIAAGAKDLTVEAKVVNTQEGARSTFSIDPLLGIDFFTDKTIYVQGDLVGASGLVKRGAFGVSVPYDFTISADGNLLFDSNGLSGKNGSFDLAFQTTTMHPAGSLLLEFSAEDSFGNRGFFSKSIELVEPKPFSALGIFLIDSLGSRLERGSRVKFTLNVLDEYGEFVDNASVKLLSPTGDLIPVEKGSGKFYTALYDVPWNAPAGEQKFRASAVKESNYTVQRGESIFIFEIEPSKIVLELLEPNGFNFSAGDEINFVLKLSYPSGDPVTETNVDARVNGSPVSLVAVEKGLYAGSYFVTPADSGRLVFSVGASDAFANSGAEEYDFQVSGTSWLYWVKVFPATAGAFLFAFALAVLIAFMFGGRMKSLSSLQKKKLDLDTLRRDAQERYYRLNSIDRQTYNNLLAKYDSELEAVNSRIESLNLKKKKGVKKNAA